MRIYKTKIFGKLKEALPDVDGIRIEPEFDNLGNPIQGDIWFESDGKLSEISLNLPASTLRLIVAFLDEIDEEFRSEILGVESPDYKYDHMKQEGA